MKTNEKVTKRLKTVYTIIAHFAMVSKHRFQHNSEEGVRDRNRASSFDSSSIPLANTLLVTLLHQKMDGIDAWYIQNNMS
eukprot:gene3931-biopygen12311